ncbi:MAG: hypothetical protein ABII27_07915 [bacterium]
MDKYSIEKLAVKFILAAAKSVDSRFISLIFASPLSARSPDVCILWHTGYKNKHRIKVLMRALLTVFFSLIKGLRKLLFNNSPFAYALYGNVKETLLVVASNCGVPAINNGYSTAYVKKEDDDALLVFGPNGSCGHNELIPDGISLKKKIKIYFILVWIVFMAYIKHYKYGFDAVLLLLTWIEWVFSLHWLQVSLLEDVLSKIIKEYSIKKVGAIHEMHFYSRVIWRVAFTHKIPGYTVQHAEVTEGKRWYFTYPEEREHGLMLPSVMYVYNKEILKMLRPYFPGTEFRFGCSSRYVRWKNVQQEKGGGSYFLFAGALARFDNDILFKALRNIMANKPDDLLVRLRLHKFAMNSWENKMWLKQKEKNNEIKISTDENLIDDLKNSSLVVGMSTTVLEEAMLLGKPVIQLVCDDFHEYIDINGIKGALRLEYSELSVEKLLENSQKEVNSAAIKHKLGLNETEVNYSVLFE